MILLTKNKVWDIIFKVIYSNVPLLDIIKNVFVRRKKNGTN